MLHAREAELHLIEGVVHLEPQQHAVVRRQRERFVEAQIHRVRAVTEEGVAADEFRVAKLRRDETPTAAVTRRDVDGLSIDVYRIDESISTGRARLPRIRRS